MTKKEIETILDDDANAGYIIRKCSGLEADLDLLLTRFFTAQKRFDEFLDIIIPKFTFAEKIQLIKVLKLTKEVKSREKLVTGLGKIRKLRNLLAHSYFLEESDIAGVFHDNELKVLFLDYPKSFNREVSYIKHRLDGLYAHYRSESRKGNY